jgi:hypothetical protein
MKSAITFKNSKRTGDEKSYGIYLGAFLVFCVMQ